MAYIVADRVKETTTVTGTGPATLAGAASGYRSFASQLSIGDTCAYVIVNSNASEWETGIGTYSAVNTLTRTTIQASTNANAAVVFSAGTKDVFMGPTADSLVDYNPVTGAISNATWNGSTISTSKGGTGLTTLGTANQALSVNSAGTALEYHTVVGSVASADGSVIVSQTGQAVDLSVAVAAAATNVVVQVRNDTGATLTKGTVVYINNAIGQLPTVAKALATSDNTSAQTLGMMSADLANNSNGFVTIIGLITGINTQAYEDGDQLYLSDSVAGTFTNVKPLSPSHLVYVGIVEYKNPSNGKIFVRVQNGYELDELHNVSAQSPSNGQTIVYNSSNQLWEKNTVSLTAGVNGTLPVANGGTGVTTATGSGSVVRSTAPTLTTATFAAGTISTSTPNTITQTWNNAAVAFSGLTMNVTDVASNAASYLVDLQVGGVSQVQIEKTGIINFWHNGGAKKLLGLTSATGSAATGIYAYGSSGTAWGFFAAGAFGFGLSGNGGTITTSGFLGWGSSPNDGNPDLRFYRDATDTLAQRRSTNAQAFRLYNTYTDASNYERLVMDWSTTSNVGYIGLQRAGTGAQRNVIVDLGGNLVAGANRIHTTGTNNVEIWSGNVQQIQCLNSTITFLGGNAYGSGATRTFGLGVSAPGNANRNADKYVFRAIGFGTGNTIPTYVGFGAAYVQSGITSTQSHTQEDCFLVRLLASATPIVAFGDSFVSTVPAIKRSGTQLQIRLADDSADASFSASYVKTPALTVATLPSASTAGMGSRAFVSDASATTFASIVASGGSNKVPVYSDGTNWLIG